MSEQWKQILGYEGLYEASSEGRIRSLDIRITRVNGQPWSRKGRVLKQYWAKVNYFVVNLSKKNKTHRLSVHRLVCIAFHGQPRPGQQVRHLNGIRTDNRAENLKWGTPSENALDSVQHSQHYLAKQTHCKRGHPFDEINTYQRPTKLGTVNRACRECGRQRRRKRYLAERASAQLPVNGIVSDMPAETVS